MERSATAPPPASLNQLAVAATTHCLTGCAIGEVAGMAIATVFGWPNGVQIGSIAAGFAIAYPFAFLANRYLIARGRRHAVAHRHHGH
jgi:hypothetical protein